MKTARFTTRGAAIVAGVLAAAAMAPTAAQASLPGTVNEVNWNVRHSWVSYITNPAWYLYLGPQGTQTRTASNGGTGVADTAGGQTAHSGYTNSYFGTKFAKDSDSGSPRTVVLQGGLDYDLGIHGINISISDIKVVYVTSTTEKINIDGSYVPSGGGTPVPLSDVDAFEVSSTGAVTLTTAGAQIFNGGTTERSYKTGDPFGTVSYS